MKFPQSLEQLWECLPGQWAFDAHDGMPEWLRTCMELRSISVNHEFMRRVLHDVHPFRNPQNKFVYVIDRDERCMTMGCLYDDWGIIYAIQA